MSSASDISTLQRESYSAKVELFLLVQERSLPIGRLRDGLMTLRETCRVPANTHGILSVSVGGNTTYSEVLLHRGIEENQHVVEFQRQ